MLPNENYGDLEDSEHKVPFFASKDGGTTFQTLSNED